MYPSVVKSGDQLSFKVYVTINYIPSAAGATTAEVPPPRRTIRRFSAEAGATFAAFCALLEAAVLQRRPCGLSIAYKDGDGDVVEVTGEAEWQEALALHQRSSLSASAVPLFASYRVDWAEGDGPSSHVIASPFASGSAIEDFLSPSGGPTPCAIRTPIPAPMAAVGMAPSPTESTASVDGGGAATVATTCAIAPSSAARAAIAKGEVAPQRKWIDGGFSVPTVAAGSAAAAPAQQKQQQQQQQPYDLIVVSRIAPDGATVMARATSHFPAFPPQDIPVMQLISLLFDCDAAMEIMIEGEMAERGVGTDGWGDGAYRAPSVDFAGLLVRGAPSAAVGGRALHVSLHMRRVQDYVHKQIDRLMRAASAVITMAKAAGQQQSGQQQQSNNKDATVVHVGGDYGRGGGSAAFASPLSPPSASMASLLSSSAGSAASASWGALYCCHGGHHHHHHHAHGHDHNHHSHHAADPITPMSPTNIAFASLLRARQLLEIAVAVFPRDGCLRYHLACVLATTRAPTGLIVGHLRQLLKGGGAFYGELVASPMPAPAGASASASEAALLMGASDASPEEWYVGRGGSGGGGGADNNITSTVHDAAQLDASRGDHCPYRHRIPRTLSALVADPHFAFLRVPLQSGSALAVADPLSYPPATGSAVALSPLSAIGIGSAASTAASPAELIERLVAGYAADPKPTARLLAIFPHLTLPQAMAAMQRGGGDVNVAAGIVADGMTANTAMP